MNELICHDISTLGNVRYNAGEYITNYLNLLNMINGSLEYIANKTVIGFDSSVISKFSKPRIPDKWTPEAYSSHEKT